MAASDADRSAGLIRVVGPVGYATSVKDELVRNGVPARITFFKGTLCAFEGATTPRSYSPCGVTLDADQPILARHADGQ
jgi:hypothetical protein